MFLIYATSSKTAEPTTQLKSDENGIPVQPIAPATGAAEISLMTMAGSMGDPATSTDMSQPPGTIPGGDGYNAWAGGGAPPAGAPPSIPPGGQVYTIDPNGGSPFMPSEGGVVLVPVPANNNPQQNLLARMHRTRILNR